jgi:hypothetical protein
MSSDFQYTFPGCRSRELPGTWAPAGTNQASASSLGILKSKSELIKVGNIQKVDNKNYKYFEKLFSPEYSSAYDTATGYWLDG